MRPELLPLIKEEPSSVVERALRLVAERVGGGYRLTGGAPRRRGGRAPDHRDISAVLVSLRNASGFVGPRNRAFFGILAATGCRVNALRQLDGTECLVLPNGRVRLYLHEKGKLERREVELSSIVMHHLHEYMEAFNHFATSRAWRIRVRLGEPGGVWRNEIGGQWGYASVLKTLKDGCTRAGVTPFTPHAFRRAFATDAASRLPRHIVAQAGGWKGLERLDDHYVQPREPTIWGKLERHCPHNSTAQSNVETHDAAAVPV
jgi:integrase